MGAGQEAGGQDRTLPALSSGHLTNATTDLMKLDHEEEPRLPEPYLSKQKKLMVSGLPPRAPTPAAHGRDIWRRPF